MTVALSDLRLAAQQRADRVNASTVSTAEWNGYINKSAGELYGILTSLYEDYNVKSFTTTLAGGSQAGNSIVVGAAPGSVIADFFQPRGVWLQVGSTNAPYVTIPRLESFAERNLYTYPLVVPVYGSIPSRWDLRGSTLEILPQNVGGATYVFWYVPTLPTLVADGDSIDVYWLTVNGWDEYVVLDAAAKALVKEESLETAAFLLQQKEKLRVRIIQEAKPRDVSQPRSIADMSRMRQPFGDLGAGGGIGGWGFGEGGGGGW